MTELNSKFDYLLGLAKERSASSRSELVSVINDLFADKSDILSDREKNLMFKIFEQLFHEIEISVRQELGEKLADRKDVPETLISYLANDEISVAYSVLSRSEFLMDTDLIKIIHERTEEHQLAISLRREVSEDVSEALVDTGSENVIVSLLNNENSKISTSTMAYLVEQSRRVDTFHDPLVHRKDLSQHMAEKMYEWVSKALRNDITSKFNIPDGVINQFLGTSMTEQLMAFDAEEEKSRDPTAELIEQLKTKGMVTPKTLMGALEQSEIPLFLGLFAEMTQLNLAFIKDIIFDGEGEEIAVACKAIGISEIEFLILLRKTRKRLAPGRGAFSHEKINEMQDFYRTMDFENSIKAVNTWRSDINGSLQEFRE